MTISSLLQEAIERGASDLHLAAGHRPTVRINGELVPLAIDKTLDDKTLRLLILSVLSTDQKERFLETRDIDFALEEKEQRFRVNVHVDRGRFALAARIIPKEIPTMDTLGLMPMVQQVINRMNGLVLVTGPAGVGKSTTLAAMINAINLSQRVHIVTLEDPIEFVFPLGQSIVKQREVGSDIDSFAGGLRHVLRQDPDVIMVGEMRDPESIAATITLAETGHLVFATLHTSSASETIQRIIDTFPATQQDQVRSQLALSLRAVISQLLLPAEGGGRVAAREVMFTNPAIANLIRENKIEQIPNVLQTGSREGMHVLKQDLTRLLKEKQISKETMDTVLASF